MKKIIVLLLLTNTIGYSQSKNSNSKHLKTIQRIYKEFITNEEDTDSDAHKKEITLSLKSLKGKLSKNDTDLIINVWLMYDPMDFPTKKLAFPILKKNKTIAIDCINQRLKTIKNKESSTYTDLMDLKNQLS